MSNSLRPHGLQPTRLLPPWDSPGKSIGVGCHFCSFVCIPDLEVGEACSIFSMSTSCSLPFLETGGPGGLNRWTVWWWVAVSGRHPWEWSPRGCPPVLVFVLPSPVWGGGLQPTAPPHGHPDMLLLVGAPRTARDIPGAFPAA